MSTLAAALKAAVPTATPETAAVRAAVRAQISACIENLRAAGVAEGQFIPLDMKGVTRTRTDTFRVLGRETEVIVSRPPMLETPAPQVQINGTPTYAFQVQPDRIVFDGPVGLRDVPVTIEATYTFQVQSEVCWQQRRQDGTLALAVRFEQNTSAFEFTRARVDTTTDTEVDAFRQILTDLLGSDGTAEAEAEAKAEAAAAAAAAATPAVEPAP